LVNPGQGLVDPGQGEDLLIAGSGQGSVGPRQQG
jgi:hypothetical protein